MKKDTKSEMIITEDAFNGIINFIGAHKAERGGFLFGSEEDHIIRKFVSDVNAKTSRSTYTIDTDYINPKIKEEWNTNGYSLLGIIHSHPHGSKSPSAPDMSYFSDLLTYVKRERFFVPIANTAPDGGFKLYPYVFHDSKPELLPAELKVVGNDYQIEKSINKPDHEKSKKKKKAHKKRKKRLKKKKHSRSKRKETDTLKSLLLLLIRTFILKMFFHLIIITLPQIPYKL